MKAWIKSPMFTLQQEDKVCLESSVEWLNDRIINAAQIMLKSQCDNKLSGWQNVLFEQRATSFKIIDEGTPFVQIILVGKSHWVTVSNVWCDTSTLKVYDSMYSDISSATIEQICSFWRCSTRSATFCLMNVQKQLNCSDCGVFAIAYATELVHSTDPLLAHRNVDLMRTHLKDGFIKGNLDCFPQTRQRRVPASNLYRKIVTVELYCHCKQPNNRSKPMIRCDSCKMWFHKKCVGISPDESFQKRKWFCSSQCTD